LKQKDVSPDPRIQNARPAHWMLEMSPRHQRCRREAPRKVTV
jgi:hypothetical protein